MGAGASGMRGRNPDAVPGENHRENQHPPSDPNSFGFAVWQLKHGEEKIIADGLVGIFSTASKR
jgi:hypothetical protein